jgi:uncharacterized membrane protein YhhN
VIIECVALYERQYVVYGFSRVVVAPILLVRLITSISGHKVNRYIYLFLLVSIVADLLTIFGMPKIEYIGLNLFTVSYLSLTCFFLQLKNNYHSTSLITFLVSFTIVVSTTIIWLFVPELHKKVFYIQVTIHTLALILLGYSFISASSKLKSVVYKNLLLSVILIIITNILFGIDVFIFHYKHSIVESLIGLGNGTYLFFITRGVLKQVKKV